MTVAHSSITRYRLPLLTLWIAAIDWAAEIVGFGALDTVAKGSTIVALIFWLRRNTRRHCPALWSPHWILLGLVASLIGDLFLQTKLSVYIGGAAFLIVHVTYLVGLGFLHQFGRTRRIVVAVIAVAAVGSLGFGLAVGAIAVYATIEATMVATAISLAWRVRRYPATVAAGGAVLFALSDVMLGIDQQAGSSRLAIVARVVYHLAQMAIISGLVNLEPNGTPGGAAPHRHPLEKLKLSHRMLAIGLFAAAGLSMSAAFDAVAHPPGGRYSVSLERFASRRSLASLNAARVSLIADPQAVAAFQRALLVDIAFPLAYCTLFALIGSGTARWLDGRRVALSELGRWGAWSFTATYAFDNLENLFLWRDTRREVGLIDVIGGFSFHTLKWASVFMGFTLIGLSLLSAAIVRWHARRPNGAPRISAEIEG